MLRLITPVILLAIAIGAVVISDRPMPPADYTFSQANDLFTLDPQRMSYTQDLRMCYAIYEGLVRWDNETFEIMPAAAESWEISSDRRTYTFRIRPNARWSNGDPVTAHDFHYSWQRALLPDTAADYTQLLFLIEGAEDYFSWRADQLDAYASRTSGERTRSAAIELRREADERFKDSVGIRVIDDLTLEVTLQRPAPYFLDLCAFGPFHPVHEQTVESWTGVDADSGRIEQRHNWTKPPHLITNGPYEVVSWRFKRDLRLEVNPHYWNQEMIRSDSVAMVIISDQNTAVLAFQTGAVDWVEDVLVDYVPELLAEKRRGERDDIHAVPAFGTYFWSFNCSERLTSGRLNPFHDPRVRKAFAMAVNKRDLTEKVRRRGEPVANTLIPPGSIAGFDEQERIKGVVFDPDSAAELLRSAGWEDRDGDGIPEDQGGDPFPVVDMLCSTGSYHEEVAQVMGAMWERTLGVRTRIVVKESKIYKDDLKRQDYMVARGGWFGDYGDPTTFLYLHRTGDGNNDRAYSDPHFDDLLDRAEQADTDERRMDLLEKAERYTMEETLPILPIFHYVRYYMFDPEEFKGVSRHPRLTQYLWKIEKVEAEG